MEGAETGEEPTFAVLANMLTSDQRGNEKEPAGIPTSPIDERSCENAYCVISSVKTNSANGTSLDLPRGVMIAWYTR